MHHSHTWVWKMKLRLVYVVTMEANHYTYTPCCQRQSQGKKTKKQIEDFESEYTYMHAFLLSLFLSVHG